MKRSFTSVLSSVAAGALSAAAKAAAEAVSKASTVATDAYETSSEAASEAAAKASDATSDSIMASLAVPFEDEQPEPSYPMKDVPLSKTSVLAVLAVLGYTGAPLPAWTAAGAAGLAGFGVRSKTSWIAFGALAALFNVPPLRRFVSKGVMQTMDKLQFLPVISETEQTAIEAGNTWMDAELFSGKPDTHTLNSQPYPDLSAEEQAFMDGPVEEVCSMVTEWEVTQSGDLPDEVWDYLKENKFFGLIVPKEHGGLGFSPSGNSAIVQKLGTRSTALGITVMVPNSLGPAELLNHYGTPEQKDYWLPKLAVGEAIPAFALTEPNAGSDAGAMTSTGEIFEDADGDLKLRLNWTKRYISLAAISDVLGLAFKLRDPDNLLGKGTDLGITCALVPSDTEGVKLGRRHDPLGIPFYNCPTEGEDVVLPIDAIIGGAEGAGLGWKMLMECLAAGRGISLPAQAAGAGKYVTRVAGAHAAVRQQFGLSIGKFEGIEEPLARIGGYTYLMDAARKYTNGGLDQGQKPSVVSAIMKYNFTEMQRDVIDDAMDILAGNAISRGPRNLLSAAYQGAPISITVEGANILTRTLMIFGQGAIRCHPYAYEEISALMEKDVKRFDKAFWPHIGHVVRNLFRSVGLSLSRGRLAGSPVGGQAKRYWQKLQWASASFAFMADLAMGSLGGALKRKEKITGRYADILSHLYLAAATLRRFEAEGRQKAQEPYFHWAMQYCFAQIQEGFDGLYENIEVPGLTWFFRGVTAPYSRLNPIGEMPSDDLGGKVAQGIQELDGDREWLSEGIFVSNDPEDALGRLEHAFTLTREAYHVGQTIKDAVRDGRLPKKRPEKLLDEALSKGIITEDDVETVKRSEAARADYIKVDSFTLEEYRQNHTVPSTAPADADGIPAGGDGAPASVGTNAETEDGDATTAGNGVDDKDEKAIV